MWLLLTFSIVGLTYIIERGYVIFKAKLKPLPEVFKMIEKLKANDLKGAGDTLKGQKDNYIVSVLLEGLSMITQDIARIEKSMESALNIKLKILEKRLGVLVILSNLAPLTGFVGTVSGMINAFRTISLADEVSTQLVASGIYEALITTVFGLIIAIVVVSAYGILTRRIDDFMDNSQMLSNELLKTLIESKIK